MKLLNESEMRSEERKKYRKYKEVFYEELEIERKKRKEKLEARKKRPAVDEEELAVKKIRNCMSYNVDYIKYKVKEKKLKKSNDMDARAIFEMLIRESRKHMFDDKGQLKDEYAEGKSARFTSLKKNKQKTLSSAYYSNRKISTNNQNAEQMDD